MKIRIVLIIVSIFVFAGCWFNKGEQVNENVSAPEEVISPYKDVEIKAVIIPAENNTFGYDIYVYDAVLVHQPSRPGLPGNAGFATAEEAMKVAELVIKKMRNNEMPPTVTIEELRELGVL